MVTGDSKWFNKMDGEQAFPVLGSAAQQRRTNAIAALIDSQDLRLNRLADEFLSKLVRETGSAAASAPPQTPEMS